MVRWGRQTLCTLSVLAFLTLVRLDSRATMCRDRQMEAAAQSFGPRSRHPESTTPPHLAPAGFRRSVGARRLRGMPRREPLAPAGTGRFPARPAVHMRAKLRFGVLVLVAALLTAGCGDDDVAGGRTGATTATGSPGAVALMVEDTDLGRVLVDSEGMTVYVFAMDASLSSSCEDECAQMWPPLTSVEGGTVDDELDEDLVGVISRVDGSTQVTYDGQPLYRYAQDVRRGDVNGHGVNGSWFAITPSGSRAAVTVSDPASGY